MCPQRLIKHRTKVREVHMAATTFSMQLHVLVIDDEQLDALLEAVESKLFLLNDGPVRTRYEHIYRLLANKDSEARRAPVEVPPIP